MQPDPHTDPGFRRAHRPVHQRAHGGSWKVAYADFVTALMCLFIVLWLTGNTKTVRDSVSGYFRDPRGYTSRMGAGPANSGEALQVNPDTVNDFRRLLEQSMKQLPDFEKFKDNVKFSVTGEGLRIDLMENAQGTFFVVGSPSPTAAGQSLLRVLGVELTRMKNRMAIEGHTDAQPFRNSTATSGYSNWELSTDRANTARQTLRAAGIGSDQVAEVRGYADQSPWDPLDPNNPKNRRISIVVKF